MSRRASLARSAIGILLAVTGATAASAQEAIATAGGSGGAPVTRSATEAPLALGEHPAFDDRGPAPVSPCAMLGLGPEATGDESAAGPPPASPGATSYPAADPPPLDRSIHGEAFAGIGTGGYREGGVTACAPLGRNAAVAVSIDAARLGR